MGSLGAAAPKPVFAYFCLAAKVGRARGHEISPGRGVPKTPRTRGREPSPLFRQGPAARLRALPQAGIHQPGQDHRKFPPGDDLVGLEAGGDIVHGIRSNLRGLQGQTQKLCQHMA